MVWKKEEGARYTREMDEFVEARLEWEWAIVEEAKETGVAVDWPGEFSLEELRTMTGPNSPIWNFWMKTSDEVIRRRFTVNNY